MLGIHRLLASATVLLLAVGAVGCSEAERETNFNEFLQSHDPATKAKRDQLVLSMDGLREKRKELEDLQDNYRSDAARAGFQQQIRQVEGMLKQMEAALAQIDEQIELAMQKRDLDRADAGGLRSREAQKLQASATTLLEQAGQLRSTMDQAEREAASESPSSQQPTVRSPVQEPALPADRSNVEREIRHLDASIANREASLANAWQTIHRITNHGKKPILKGSQDHAAYLSAREVRIQCEAELPGLKARRDRLREHLESLDSPGE
jgi:hypothetical protein